MYARARRRRARCSSDERRERVLALLVVAVAARVTRTRRSGRLPKRATRSRAVSWFDATRARHSPGSSPSRDTRRAGRRGSDPGVDASTATRGRVAEVVHAPSPSRSARRSGANAGREARATRSASTSNSTRWRKRPAVGVGVLVGLDDVAARVGDERADARDDAGPVGALEQEHGAHGIFRSAPARLRRA